MFADARQAIADFVGWRAERDRVRSQCHVACVSRVAGAGRACFRPATKSSSPSSTIMPMSGPGRRLPARRDCKLQVVRMERRNWRARLERLREKVNQTHPAGRGRSGVERSRHDHRRPARGRDWPTPSGADVRRCRSLRAAQPSRCAGARVRLPDVLGVQVLRAARGAALVPARVARVAAVRQARARAEHGAGAAPKPARSITKALPGRPRRSIFWHRLDRARRDAINSLRLSPRSTNVRRAHAIDLGGTRPKSTASYSTARPPEAARTSTIAFTVHGVPSSEVARRLAEHALFLSHGNFYAATVIERLGLAPEGLVRAGCACYTTSDEVARLVAAVRNCRSRARGLADQPACKPMSGPSCGCR